MLFFGPAFSGLSNGVRLSDLLAGSVGRRRRRRRVGIHVVAVGGGVNGSMFCGGDWCVRVSAIDDGIEAVQSRGKTCGCPRLSYVVAIGGFSIGSYSFLARTLAGPLSHLLKVYFHVD